MRGIAEHTLDGVCLCQLREVGDEVFRQSIPFLALLHAKVDVSARELVDMKLRESASETKQSAELGKNTNPEVTPAISPVPSVRRCAGLRLGLRTICLPPSRIVSGLHLCIALASWLNHGAVSGECERTLKLVFADVDEPGRVDYAGGVVVDHDWGPGLCLCRSWLLLAGLTLVKVREGIAKIFMMSGGKVLEGYRRPCFSEGV